MDPVTATTPTAPGDTGEAVAKVTLRKGREERVRLGHPWVFAGEVYQLPPAEADGLPVAVEDARGRLMGVGLANTRSNILVRLLSRQREPLDRAFFERRIEEAIALRTRFGRLSPGPDAAWRVIHGEADGLPGLIVDRYGAWLVVQALSLGMAQRLPMIVELLQAALKPRGIYERSDVPVRTLEGLVPTSGVLAGEAPPEDLVIEEHGMRLRVDLVGGQKTGFFLDQRLNRAHVRHLSSGLGRVLNTFCYSGGFSVAAALGGAERVVSVDISADAIALAEQNAALNEVSGRCEFHTANAFDALREYERAGERFDMVILDPPAFTKNKDSIPGAVRGYKEINLRAMRLLEPGGLLVTSSCSHHISPALFSSIVADAAADTRKRLRQIALRGPSPDHPVLPVAPETDYLKYLVAEVR
ncbi:MAG: class I SAM-dependent rRNA methyltransferase [Candidatus Sericytochromatia bacterium]|nr:class I SAM-dependent rRNA methyltransferase [Candidatus Sericytochromatia bacterium]